MDKTIQLNDLFSEIAKRWKAIVIFIFLGLILSLGESLLVQPMYEASNTLIIPPTAAEIKNNYSVKDINIRKIGLLKSIINSEDTARLIAKQINKNESKKITSKSIQGSFNVINVDGSQYYTIISNAKYLKTAKIQNEVGREILKEELEKKFGYQKIVFSDVLDDTVENYFPRIGMNLAFGAVIGFLLGILYILFKPETNHIKN